MQVWNLLHAARWKHRTQKSRQKSPPRHHRTTLSGYIFGTKACIVNWKKNLLNSNISSTCPDNMVNFGLLTAEIRWRVWGTPANFSGFRVLAALLHGTLVVGVSQTLRHWTEGATYIRHGGHHVGHWLTFWLMLNCLIFTSCPGCEVSGSVCVCLSVCLWACLSVCPVAYIRNSTFKLHETFCTCCLGPRGLVLLWRHCNTLCPILWMSSCSHNGPNTDTDLESAV